MECKFNDGGVHLAVITCSWEEVKKGHEKYYVGGQDPEWNELTPPLKKAFIDGWKHCLYDTVTHEALQGKIEHAAFDYYRWVYQTNIRDSENMERENEQKVVRTINVQDIANIINKANGHTQWNTFAHLTEAERNKIILNFSDYLETAFNNTDIQDWAKRELLINEIKES